jgi:hypothetical protein
MGEEWGADTPWQYFTDHIEPWLAQAVAEGRKNEFAGYGWDAADVPDPQDEATFLRSKLDWEQRHRDPHLGLHAWYKELIALRRARPELTDPRLDRVQADFDENARWLLVRRGRLRIAANLGSKAVRLPLGQRGTGVLATSSPGVAIKQDMVTMPPDTFAVIETRALNPQLRALSYGPGAVSGWPHAARASSGRAAPNTSATVVRAQRIRVTAVSGYSPKACATSAAQPEPPRAAMVAAMACRTCPTPGLSERCSADANSASTRTVLMPRS